MKIILIESAADAKRCFPLMNILRPNLIEKEYIKRLQQQKEQGYQLVACIDEEKEVAALAGFRFQTYMAWGKVLYIDDLVTDPKKKRNGFGGALIDWIEKKAIEENCDKVHLDTGYGRQDAHRLYLKKGLELYCHHLTKKLKT